MVNLKWLDVASSVSVILPLIQAAVLYPLLNKELKLVAVFFLFAGFTELGTSLMSAYHVNNLPFVNIYNLTEACFFIWLISRWAKSPSFKKMAVAFALLYIFLWSYTMLMQNGFYEFNPIEKTVKSLLLIVLSGAFLIRLSLNEDVKILSIYQFWISSGILIFCMVTLVVFASAGLLLSDDSPAMQYTWSIHSAINIIANCMFYYAFICYRKTSSYSSV